jgi:3-hydroxy acid dehydrogenase / malonic semialdehyde reductase
MKKVALITGATSGIGSATTTRFLDEGWRVIALGRRIERLEEMRNSLASTIVPNLFIGRLDVSDSDATQNFFASLPDGFSDVDLLVNNAGGALGLEPAQSADSSDWDQMIDVNIKGVMHLTGVVLPGMLQRHRGHIINIGSVAGTYPYPGGNVYGATKAFVHQYTQDLREQLADTPIRFTSIEPGMVSNTEFSNVRFKGDLQRVEKIYENVEAMSPKDIAEAIYWVANTPPSMNINRIQLMPVQQAFGPQYVHRASPN